MARGDPSRQSDPNREDAGSAPLDHADRRRTLLWTSSSYFGQGLPWSFLHQLATEYLTATGASSRAIGSTSLFHFAVTLKFLWSPVVDLFGRKRTWLGRTQVGPAVALALAD